MVALDEQFHHEGAKARSRRGRETAQSETSLARRTMDVASARRCRATSVSSFTSCAHFKNRISAPSSFVSLCRCGETRHRRGTSIYSVFQNRPLLIDHCSLIIKRSADAYGNTLIFTAPDTAGNWWGDAAVQSDNGANEIICCGYRFDPETQLYNVRNRTYNPVLGRWIQRDPIGYSGGINLYGYVESAPVGSVDASGLYVPINERGQFFDGRFFYSITGLLPNQDGETSKVTVKAGGQTWLLPLMANLMGPEADVPATIIDAYLHKVGLQDFARIYGDAEIIIKQTCGKRHLFDAKVGFGISAFVGYNFSDPSGASSKQYREGFGFKATLALNGLWDPVKGRMSLTADASLWGRVSMGWGWFQFSTGFYLNDEIHLASLPAPAPLASLGG